MIFIQGIAWKIWCMVRIGLFGMFSKMSTYIEICDHVLSGPEWSLQKKAQTVPLARTPWPGFCYHSLFFRVFLSNGGAPNQPASCYIFCP